MRFVEPSHLDLYLNFTAIVLTVRRQMEIAMLQVVTRNGSVETNDNQADYLAQITPNVPVVEAELSTINPANDDKFRSVISPVSLQASPFYKQVETRADEACKRTLDFLLALVFLVVAAPIMVLISIMVATDGGAVFFRHTRLGRDLKRFSCLKFRTMIPGAETTLQEYLALHPEEALEWRKDHKLSLDIRVTPIGRFLRKTSLDELPQLFNVVRGEMSLVGPRPVTDNEIDRYGDALPLYSSVRPGVTGLWQVSGRSDVTYEGRIDMDRRYIQQRNNLRDLMILFVSTPRVLISRKGAR